MFNVRLDRPFSKLMKNPVTLGHLQYVSRGHVLETVLAMLLDWLTGTPFYLTFPALLLTPLIVAACTAQKARPRS